MLKHLIIPLLLLVTSSLAFSEDELKIAVVDIQKVIADSVIGKAARSNVETEAKKSQARLDPLKVELERSQADLEKQSTLLSGSALEDRRDQLQRKQVAFERAVQDAREQFAKKNEFEIGKVVTAVEKVVKELATERRYTFVLERDNQSILYAGAKVDISDEVIKILDTKHVAL